MLSSEMMRILTSHVGTHDGSDAHETSPAPTPTLDAASSGDALGEEALQAGAEGERSEGLAAKSAGESLQREAAAIKAESWISMP